MITLFFFSPPSLDFTAEVQGEKRTQSLNCSGAGEMVKTNPLSKYFVCAARIVDLIFQYPTLRFCLGLVTL